MVYVQFLDSYKGEIKEALGSDGYYILDGRNKLSTMIKDAHARMQKLHNVQPGYIGFKIYRDPENRLGGQIIYQTKK